MNTLSDIQSVLKLELIHNYNIDSSHSFYLYYHPTTAQRDGDLIIAINKPNGYKLAMPEKINRFTTIEDNFNRICLSGRLNRLPILSIS